MSVRKNFFMVAVFGPALHGICAGFNANSFDVGTQTLKSDYVAEISALRKGVTGILDSAKNALK